MNVKMLSDVLRATTARAVLSVLLFSPAASPAQPCPDDAQSASVYVSVLVFQQPSGYLGIRPLLYGETARVQMVVLYLPRDRSDNVTAACQGGRMILSFNGQAIDVTPTNGVPVIGPRSCGGVDVVFSQPVFFVGRGQPVYVVADYIDGQAMLSTPASISARGGLYFYASQRSRLRISGNIISFAGEPGRAYTIEGSRDLRTWETVGTAVPDEEHNGRFEIDTGGSHRFYRYALK